MKDEVNHRDEGQHKKSRTQAWGRCFNGYILETEFPSNSGSYIRNQKGKQERSTVTAQRGTCTTVKTKKASL